MRLFFFFHVLFVFSQLIRVDSGIVLPVLYFSLAIANILLVVIGLLCLYAAGIIPVV